MPSISDLGERLKDGASQSYRACSSVRKLFRRLFDLVGFQAVPLLPATAPSTVPGTLLRDQAAGMFKVEMHLGDCVYCLSCFFVQAFAGPCSGVHFTQAGIRDRGQVVRHDVEFSEASFWSGDNSPQVGNLGEACR